MEVDSEKKTDESAEKTDTKTAEDKPAAVKSITEDADKEKEKKEEPLFEMLENPARALPAQITTGGIFMLVDSQKGQPEELIELLQANIPGKEDEEPEPEPPEPFEWHDDQ
ncbi:26S proteasome non-ATPase regulatory subunit 1-like isoform X2 [Dysidea avara]|uniref:26S proteasome non-ATPase regulatory subunit 1-like isoform X2 n=1 Tax=Dysidea avara TaxID=196820 RepID=UPI00331E0DD2